MICAPFRKPCWATAGDAKPIGAVCRLYGTTEKALQLEIPANDHPHLPVRLRRRKRGRECPVEKLDETKDQDVVDHGHESHFASACVIGVRRQSRTLMLFGQ